MTSIEINCTVCKISFIPEKKIIKRCDKCRTKYHCEHKKRKNRCVDCGGSQICEHKKQSILCTDCTRPALHTLELYVCPTASECDDA